MMEMSEEVQDTRDKRLKQLTDIAPEDKAYIVVQGRPRVWYCNSENGATALINAEEQAGRLCEETQEEYTVMCVPRASVDIALVAKYHGVVLHALDRLEADDER